MGGVEVKCVSGTVDLRKHANPGGSANINSIWDHVWLKLEDGRILDPTADQFTNMDGSAMPAVFLGKKPDWYFTDKHT